MRKMIVKEDYKSVAFLECHAQGFIPFCLENPHLRVERRVDIWWSILPGWPGWRALYIPLTHQNENPQLWSGVHELAPGIATTLLATWIEEAIVLPLLGMPSSSFSLIFEAWPDKSSQELFEFIKRDAAWQDATDQYHHRNRILASPDEKKVHRCYWSKSFPEAIKDIIKGTSFIHFNTFVGDVWDVEKILFDNAGCSAEEWKANWKKART